MDKNFIYFVNPFYTGGEIHDLMFNGEEVVPMTETTLKPLIYQVLRSLNYMNKNNIPVNIYFFPHDWLTGRQLFYSFGLIKAKHRKHTVVTRRIRLSGPEVQISLHNFVFALDLKNIY